MMVYRPLNPFLTVQVKCTGRRSDKALGVDENDLGAGRSGDSGYGGAGHALPLAQGDDFHSS
jgi:hypothetical protein